MAHDDILAILNDVPDYQEFRTVDEMHANSRRLAAEHPDVVKIISLGESRTGFPIEALQIGDGAKTGMMVGLPHPNEPIGAMMLEFFTQRLAEDAALRDQLGYTWFIVKSIDPDGTKLNEGWFKGPFTVTNYARNFYRPPSVEQIEWTFPVHYKTYNFDSPLPETRAWMKLIDMHPPDFLFSLHNSGFGGSYLYISDDLPGLYPRFHDLVHRYDLPLHLGEPEVPYATKYADAVFGTLSLKAAYDFMEQMLGSDPADKLEAGAASLEYASRAQPLLYLVCEMPYFYSPAIKDTSSSGTVRRAAILERLAFQRRQWGLIEATWGRLAPVLKVQSPFRSAIENNLKTVKEYLDAEETWARTAPETDQNATVAELFDNQHVARFYSLLSLGVFLRMIETEIEHSGSRAALAEAHLTVQDAFDHLASDLETTLNYSVIPLRRLVQVQLGSALLALSEIRG